MITEQSYDNADKFMEHVNNLEFDKAKKMIEACTDLHESEFDVLNLFKIENRSLQQEELLHLSLESFYKSYESIVDKKQEYDLWCHSYTHFSKKLYANKMYEWIQKLNTAVFEGERVFGDNWYIEDMYIHFDKCATNDMDLNNVCIPEKNYNEWKESKERKRILEMKRLEEAKKNM